MREYLSCRGNSIISHSTTIEADPRGAASFLRSLKRKDQSTFHPDKYKADWFERTQSEVEEKLGRSSLWDNPSPVGIGFDYEILAGVNIGGTQRVIDDVNVTEGIVTSMKTMDTHSYTYQSGDNIYSVGKRYVDAFKKFDGVNTKDLTVPLNQIKGFHLEIAVRTDITQEQRTTLRNIQGYGQINGVRVIIAQVA